MSDNVPKTDSVLMRAAKAATRWDKHTLMSSWVRIGGMVPAFETLPVAADNGDHPEGCGTTLCLAAWIAFQNAPSGAELSAVYVLYPNGDRETISEYAEATAGLTSDQAGFMFHAITEGEILPMATYLDENPRATIDELIEARDSSRVPA